MLINLFKYPFFAVICLLNFQGLICKDNPAIHKKHQYVVVGDIYSAPYAFYDKDENPDGYDVELINAIAKVMDIDIKIKLYDWNLARKDIESGKADVLLGMISSGDRKHNVDFSIPHLSLNSMIFTRKGEPEITNEKDLTDKEIIVQEGSIAHDYLLKSKITSKIILVPSSEYGLKLLASGKHDCALITKLQGLSVINKNLLLNLAYSEKPLYSSEYCFAVKKGDSLLLNKINQGLVILKSTDQYDKIYNKWFGVSDSKAPAGNNSLHYAMIIIIVLVIVSIVGFYLVLIQTKKIKIKTAEFQKEIEDRKRIEKTLLEREEILNQASKIAQIGNWIWDGNANIMICSPEVFEILGMPDRTDATIAIEDYYLCIHSDDREALKQEVQRSFSQNNNFEAEFRVIRTNGEIRYARSKGLFLSESNSSVRMTGVMQDITEHKLALLKIEYSNRLYSFLSHVNDAIVHFPNANRLFNEVCRLGVEYGKFALVWIGIADEKTGAVKVESFAGQNDGFLSTLKISVKDNALGQGTFGRAFRSDGCAFLNDLTRDEDLIQGRWEAAQKGFRSEAAFVLKKDGKKIGALAFYSSEINFFGENEIKLITEITENIAFAIDNVEKENIRNITRRALIESQEKYLSVFNAVSDAIFLMDQSTGVILDANLAAVRLYSYTYEELISIKIMDLSAESFDTADSLLEQIDMITFNFHKRKDGSVFPVEVMSSFFMQNNRRFAVAVVRDLTESIKARERLIESEKRYSSLFQNNRAVMVLFEADTGRFVDANPAACLFYGYNKEEFLNLTIADINILSPEECFDEIQKVIKNQNSHLYFKHRLADGEVKDVEAFTGAMNLIGKEVYYSIVYDITERRKAELDLIAAKEKAEEASRLKTSLLGNMSHELRTPLTGILGFSQILIDEIQEEFLREMVEKIQRSGKRLMTTLNSILNISELESGRLDIQLLEINLAYCLKDKMHEFEQNAIEKNLTFEFKPLDKNIFCYVDEKFLVQIVESLVDNAIKYTETGGVKVFVDSEKDDGKFWGVIKVADTGIGISDELHDLIFEEFRQASEGFSRSFEGSGLGLTIAKKMTKLLGGDIKVESKLGEGSVFTVKLPGYIEFSNFDVETANLVDDVKEAAAPAREIKQQDKYTSGFEENLPLVLLVEDNYINSDVTIMFLKGVCRVEHSIDGETAISMASENKYDAILMDINLGGKINGIEALKEIRKISDYEKTPAVALTGYAMSGDKEKLISEGFDNYLSKPFDKDDIVNVVKLAIGRGTKEI
jgi:PAS domain S-box-containing protein